MHKTCYGVLKKFAFRQESTNFSEQTQRNDSAAAPNKRRNINKRHSITGSVVVAAVALSRLSYLSLAEAAA